MDTTKYKRVMATAQEHADYERLRKHRPRPGIYRVQCLDCGARLWASGLGIGSHNRVCFKGRVILDHDDPDEPLKREETR